MQIHNASAESGNGAFLHIGYLSAGRPHFEDSAADQAVYSAFDGALAVTRYQPATGGQAALDATTGGRAVEPLLEPGWTAPGEYGSLYRQVFAVDYALAADRPAFSLEAAQAVAPIAQTTPPEINHAEPWQPLQEAVSFYLVAVLLCGLGVALLAAARRGTARLRVMAAVVIAAALLVCVIVPAARGWAAPRDTTRLTFIVNPAARGGADQPTYSLVGAEVAAAPAGPLKYQHPAEATMVLMHGLINPWLRGVNRPLPTLELGSAQDWQRDGGAAIPLPYCGVSNCTHDGWGREFRYELLDISYEPTGNGVSAWSYLLQSAGADGRFDTADDFRHVRRLEYWDGSEEDGDNAPPYYGVFVYVAWERDWRSDYLVFLPRVGTHPQQRGRARTTFARRHFAMGHEETPGAVTSRGMLINDHRSLKSPGLSLQLYALSGPAVQQ